MLEKNKDRLFRLKQYRGHSLAIMGAICAALYFVPYRFAVKEFTIQADTYVFGLILISFLINSSLLVIKRDALKINKPTIYGAIIFAVLSIIGNYANGLSISALTPSLTATIVRAQIIFVMFLGLIVLKEKISGFTWIGTFIILIGIYIMASSKGSIEVKKSIGIVWGLVSALSFSSLHIITKKIINRIYPVSLNLLRLFIATIIMGSIPGKLSQLLSLPVHIWGLIFISAFTGPTLSRIFQIYSLKYLPVSKFILFSMLTPVFALIFSGLILNDIPKGMEIFGGAIVLLGIAIPILPLDCIISKTQIAQYNETVSK